jgi:hypothetical protein
VKRRVVVGIVAVVAAVAVIAVVVTQRRTDQPSGPARVKPVAWAKSACGTLRPWAQGIQTAVTNAQSSFGKSADPVVVKPQLDKLFGDAATSTGAAITAIDKAGIPDVKNGERIAKDFRTALVGARDAFAKAQKAVAALNPADKAKFAPAVSKIGSQLGADYGAAGKQLTSAPSTELKAAFDKTPECNA